MKYIAMAIGVYFVEFEFGYSLFVFDARGTTHVIGRWKKEKKK
jgi:hypothetical protein